MSWWFYSRCDYIFVGGDVSDIKHTKSLSNERRQGTVVDDEVYEDRFFQG